MKKLENNARKRLIIRLNQILALMGISVVFASCYAPAPMEDYPYNDPYTFEEDSTANNAEKIPTFVPTDTENDINNE